MALGVGSRSVFPGSVQESEAQVGVGPGAPGARGESVPPAQATCWRLGVPRALLPLPAQGPGLDWSCLQRGAQAGGRPPALSTPPIGQAQH